MIRIVTFKWNGEFQKKKGKNFQFSAEHVNKLYRMLKRNIRCPFELICITDNPTDISSEIRIIPLWDDHRNMGGCYTRLRLFSDEMKKIIGPDFFAIDLDTLVLRDITQLLRDTQDRHEFKIWGDTNPTTPYNGSFFYLKSGTRKKVWETFNPKLSPDIARKKGYVGTDQAWIGAALGPLEARWSKLDGIYSYRVHFQQTGKRTLQGDEKIIFFHGSNDPSKEETQVAAPWVLDYYK